MNEEKKCDAILLEMEEEGEFRPYEIAVREDTNLYDNEDPRMNLIDALDTVRLAEYPDVVVTYGDDWNLRLGLGWDAGYEGLDENGEICGVTNVFFRKYRWRARLVSVSGRPAPSFAEWLDERPYVRWSLREHL